MDRLLDWLRTLPVRVLDSAPALRVGAWYRSLTERDQLALTWLLTFGLLLALLYGVILPLWAYQNDGQQRYLEASETLTWIESKAPQLAALQGGGRGLIDGSVGTTLTQTSKHYNLVFKRLEPVGNQQANVWLEQVPFNQLVGWLGMLQNDHGIRAQLLEVTREREGIVDARLILEG